MAELATAVDGGHLALCIDSMPGQGLHIIPPNEKLGTAARQMEEVQATPMEPMTPKAACIEFC